MGKPQVDSGSVYEQLKQDYRSLNGLLWQLPVLVTTLTGGLWVGAANAALSDLARSRLLLFAGISDLLVIVALFRMRSILASLQLRIRDLEGGALSRVNYIVVVVFSLILAAAGVGSLMASASPERYFKPAPAVVRES